MEETRNKIMAMVEEGKVSVEEAEQLMDTLKRPQRSRWRWMLLLDPYEQLGEKGMLAVAVVVAVTSMLI
ncbi:MAG: hypothetical protein AAGJ35_15960 [Myxococcota bacterium]